MNVSVAEVVSLLRGKASTDTRARFVDELGNPHPETLALLQGAAEWACQHLNPLCPSKAPSSTFVPGESDVRPYVVLRKAAFGDEKHEEFRPANVLDLAAFLQGRALDAQLDRIKRDLLDPDSEVYQTLTGWGQLG